MSYVVVRSIAPGTMNSDTQERSKVGHAWLEIHHPDGRVESLGFYPEQEGSYFGPGRLDTKDHDAYEGKGYTSPPISITDDQAQAIRDTYASAAAGTYEGVPMAGIHDNCASVAFGAMKEAGLAVGMPLRNVLPWWMPYRFTPADGNLMDLELGIDFSVNADFLAARGLLGIDPLAIDLDGDGIETVGTAAGVLFDHDGDDIKTGTGWVTGDDAFVVLDRDGNGQIDSGRELFGVDTVVGTDALGNPLYAKDGFDALASLDSNADNLFDANDADYADVRLWRDLNQDGISQSNELQSLADAGITAIDLAAQQARQTLAGGNVQTLSAGVAGIGGSAVALDLASNPFYRDYPDSLDTTAVADLPDMQGSGSLRDLKETATQSAMLESQLRALATQGYVNRAAFLGQIETLIVAWADTSAMQTWAQRQAQAAQQTMYLNWNDGPATSAGKHTLANAGAVGMEIPFFDIHIIYQPQGVTRSLIDPTVSIGSGDGTGDGTVTIDPTGDGLTEAERTEQLAKWARANYLIETLPTGRKPADAKAAPRESRSWRDGTRKAREAANGASWRRVS